MRNRLFDSIIQTSGADTDDIHSGEAEGNFWAENPLFEAVLREMSILNKEAFWEALENSLSAYFGKVSSKIEIETIDQIVDYIVLNNKAIESPFAIVDDNNYALVINNACDEYKRKLNILIERRYPSYYLSEIETEEPISNWITNTVNSLFDNNRILLQNITQNSNITQEAFTEAIKTNFNRLYLAHQRGQPIR